MTPVPPPCPTHKTVCLHLARRSKFRALAWSMYFAFQYFAMLIHLAQLALGIDFIPAMYQQVIHNQSTACANAESIFHDQ
jgi:hypothetical protein